MQLRDQHFFPSNRKKEDFGISHGLPQDSDLSQTSYTGDRSQSTTASNFHRPNSIRASARDVAGAFITCFVPGCGRSGKGSTRNTIEESDFSSTSISKISSASTSGHSRFMYTDSATAKGIYRTKSPQHEKPGFSIAEIYKATGNFSVENKIGQGGFGTVYRGKLKDGSLVAVKRARRNKCDRHLSVEFRNETFALSKVEHLNLVRFLGFLEHGDERLIVVEYVSNGTLREHLDGSRGSGLEIAERLEIAIGVAHALAYLHTYTDHPIIHRDIKASNVLLTEKLRAKVADFGFARLASADPEVTHVSTQVMGSAGYVDPEYLRTYQLTDKSDVYSFGVLLVELITGRRPIEHHRNIKDRATTRWAMQRYREGDAVLAMDPRMRRTPAAIMVVEKIMALASECLAPSRRSRPAMKRCGEVLWGVRKDYREMLQAATSPWPTPQSSQGGDKSSERERGGGSFSTDRRRGEKQSKAPRLA